MVLLLYIFNVLDVLYIIIIIRPIRFAQMKNIIMDRQYVP